MNLISSPYQELIYGESPVTLNVMAVMVVGKPNYIVNGLCSLLNAHPNLSVLTPEKDVSSVSRRIDEGRPHLVIFDSSLPHDEVMRSVVTVKRQYPHILCIVVVDKMQHYHDALSNGADGALFTGFPVEHLLRTINKLQNGNYQTFNK